MARVRWGVLSTASIGRLVIEATRAADHAAFVAVASRDPARARAFAGELGLEASFGSYEELLASSQVDAATPRPPWPASWSAPRAARSSPTPGCAVLPTWSCPATAESSASPSIPTAP